MSFDTLGLCETLVNTIAAQGYSEPSPIQAQAIPVILNQQDVMAAAQTGTGKTAAFTLPILQRLFSGPAAQPKAIRALIIVPTRELAAQVAKNVATYSQHLPLRCAAVFGGVRIESQLALLQTGVDVLVATPGRLLDLYNQQALHFEQLEIVVLDEADRMLELGFIDDIKLIQSLLPVHRQTLMFSATFSKTIKTLARGLLNKPVMIALAAANLTLDNIEQRLHPVDKTRKTELLLHLIKQHDWPQVLVFCRTKQGADLLAAEIKQAGITSEAIHANRSQHARTLALDDFKNKVIKVLVATDIAARGIDMTQLPCVINLDLPYVAEDYVHRIGRTGRAGATGLALSLYSEDESKQLHAIERLLGRQFKRSKIAGFSPTFVAPAKSRSTAEDEELYGNFEPAPGLEGRQPKGRKKRRGR